jgi:(p)ppGpp synthase/HD superfamily hydrolase
MVKKGDKFERDIIVEVSDDEQLQDIVGRLNRIRNVLDVKRSD